MNSKEVCSWNALPSDYFSAVYSQGLRVEPDRGHVKLLELDPEKAMKESLLLPKFSDHPETA